MTMLVSLLLSAFIQHPAMPEAAMGFDQDKATHHFRKTDAGGTIEVAAKDPKDAKTIAQIQAHLKTIAKAFADGDFSKPVLTHGEEPPGVPVMQRRKRDITYQYVARPRGALVRITTADAEARRGIHAFLEYQIREHHGPSDNVGR